MELSGITGPGTAFIAGLITSLHCAGMCGPLACSVMPGPAAPVSAPAVSSVYHLARLAAYAGLGALAGGLGRLPLSYVGESGWRYLPWLLVAYFIVMAARVEQRLPRLPVLGRAYGFIAARLRGRSRLAAAATLGAATPLLPCGPLYLLVSLALLAGSAPRGAEILLAFGLGTVPLLWVAQVNYHWLRLRLGPVWLGRARTTLAVAAALVITWRLRGTLGLGGPGASDFVCF